MKSHEGNYNVDKEVFRLSGQQILDSKGKLDERDKCSRAQTKVR